jgi:hypothetical protein
MPDLEDARFVARQLSDLGFEILNFHGVAISFTGTPGRFKDVFGLRLRVESQLAGRGRRLDVRTVEPEDAPRLTALPSIFDGRAEAIAIAQPPRLIDDAGSPVRDIAASEQQSWSLPDELALSIWGEDTRTAGGTGKGVVAALIGTGHHRHRFFAERGYRVLPTLLGPGLQAPLRDDHGHSTGEAACLFAAAPDLRLRPIKGLADPVGDILMAVDSAPRPDLIVTSWGYDVDQEGWGSLATRDPNLHHYLRMLEAAVAYATASGIVICSAAPRTWQSFPASHPDIIAIGAASNGRGTQRCGQAGKTSGLYPGRIVPDFWSDASKSVRAGLDLDLVGCTHPVQPGSVLSHAGPPFGIDNEDGFAWCDVESAACPLAAGMLALLIQRHRGLPPIAIKSLMIEAAHDLAAIDPTDPSGTEGDDLAVGLAKDRALGVLPEAASQRVALFSPLADEPFVKTGVAG